MEALYHIKTILSWKRGSGIFEHGSSCVFYVTSRSLYFCSRKLGKTWVRGRCPLSLSLLPFYLVPLFVWPRPVLFVLDLLPPLAVGGICTDLLVSWANLVEPCQSCWCIFVFPLRLVPVCLFFQFYPFLISVRPSPVVTRSFVPNCWVSWLHLTKYIFVRSTRTFLDICIYIFWGISLAKSLCMPNNNAI